MILVEPSFSICVEKIFISIFQTIFLFSDHFVFHRVIVTTLLKKSYFPKQPPEVFCKKSYSYKFHKIHRKTTVPESLFLIKKKHTFFTEHLLTTASETLKAKSKQTFLND